MVNTERKFIEITINWFIFENFLQAPSQTQYLWFVLQSTTNWVDQFLISGSISLCPLMSPNDMLPFTFVWLRNFITILTALCQHEYLNCQTATKRENLNVMCTPTLILNLIIIIKFPIVTHSWFKSSHCIIFFSRWKGQLFHEMILYSS